MEPLIGSTSELPLKELIQQLGANKAPWTQLRLDGKVTEVNNATGAKQ
jgi:hypothetical protein